MGKSNVIPFPKRGKNSPDHTTGYRPLDLYPLALPEQRRFEIREMKRREHGFTK